MIRMKIFITKKLAAGSLYYTIILAFIVYLFISFCFLYVYLNGSLIDKKIITDQKETLIESTLLSLFNSGQLEQLGGVKKVRIFDDIAHEVDVSMSYWGAYKLVSARINIDSSETEKYALVGDELSESDKISIYLPNNDKSLTLAGKSEIHGKCYLPRFGISTSTSRDHFFEGILPEVPEINKSLNTLPALPVQILSSLCKITQPSERPDSVSQLNEYDGVTSVYRQFNQSTLKIIANGTARIENMSFAGNIILQSDSLFVVSNSAYLNDVIVTAPYIVLERGFVGNAQFIATKSILVQDYCHLEMPSTLAIISNTIKDKKITKQIEIGDNSIITGLILLIGKESNNMSRIILHPTSKVYGQIYTDRMVEHCGSVFGSIYCSQFYYKSDNRDYFNFLNNAITDVGKLPPEYLGFTCRDSAITHDIIKWLN